MAKHVTQDDVIFKRIRQQQEGLTAEKQVADVTGGTKEGILRGKGSRIDQLEYQAKEISKVQSSINGISVSLTGDINRQEAAKNVLQEIVGDDELTTETEKVDSLTHATFGDEYTTENEIEAKKAVSTAKRIGLKDSAGVGLYSEKKLKDGLIEQAEKESGSLTDREKELLKRKAELISGDGIGNQAEIVATRYRNDRGRAATEFYKLRAVTKIIKDPKILEENEEINKKLGNKIPRNPRLAAFDDVATLLNRNGQVKKLLSVSQGGNNSFLMRFKIFFYNFSRGWTSGVVQNENGIVTRVGRQSVNDYVNNSMGILMMGMPDGIKQILQGIAGKGVNAVVKNLTGDAALKLAAGAVGPAGLAATKVIGGLKKFFGGLGEKLGPGMKRGLGNGVDKGGNWLMKAAFGLGALLTSIGGLGLGLGTAVASTATVGAVAGTVGFFAYNQYLIPAGTVSGLVSVKKTCDSEMDYIKTNEKDPIPCGNMSAYDTELEERISAAGYQTRCAVAAAAQYLTIDFPYWISYGFGQYYCPNGISENWCGDSRGLDCNSFIAWAYRQGGFAIKKGTRSPTWQGSGAPFETEKIPFNVANCARIQEIVKPGDIVARTGHKGIVIGVEEGRLQIAQENLYPYGLEICYINPCSGTGRGLEIKASDGEKHACNGFTELWSMDNFFDYYTSGGKSLNGLSIEPNSEIKTLKDLDTCNH